MGEGEGGMEGGLKEGGDMAEGRAGGKGRE